MVWHIETLLAVLMTKVGSQSPFKERKERTISTQLSLTSHAHCDMDLDRHAP